MPNDLETLIREAAPRVTRQPEAALAAVAASDEARDGAQSRRHRRRAKWAVGVAALVVAVGGATGAVAANRTIWWDEPHHVASEGHGLYDPDAPARTVSCILSADYADGVDGSSADAKQAFQLGQDWLIDRPMVIEVPLPAQRLTEGEELQALKDFSSDGKDDPWALQTALDFKALLATEDARGVAVTTGHDALVTALGAYLIDQGADPALIVVADPNYPVCDVLR